MTRPTTRRLTALAAAGTLSLALSGCGIHPGDAATVGSRSIGVSRLDDVALAICSAQARNSSPGQVQAQSSRSNRELALGVLIDSRLTDAYSRAFGLRPSQQQLEKAESARTQLIATVPSGRRSVLRSTLRDLDKSQLTMAEVGRQALQRSGTTNITPQTAIPAGLKVRDAWVKKHVKVTVDPRFGSWSGGRLKAKGGSLSSAVSTKAVDAEKSQPSSSFLSSLPGNQKCS